MCFGRSLQALVDHTVDHRPACGSARPYVFPDAGAMERCAIALDLAQSVSFGGSHDAIRALITQHDAIMLAYHGSLTVGSDVWQAYLKLETLEHTAVILHRTAQLGPIRPLPPEEVARLLEIRRQSGYWRPGDEERFCEACGVC